MITLKDIEYNKFSWDKQLFESTKKFLWAFKWDIDEIIGTRELMYKEWTNLQDWDKRLIDKELWISYWIKYSFITKLQLTWLLEELFGESTIQITVPKILKTSNVVEISWKNILQYYIKPLVKGWYLSDKYYLVIAPILRLLPLWWNKQTWYIWFIKEDIKDKKALSKYLIEHKKWNNWWMDISWDISLEQVLEAELKQWYSNKDIWDVNRWYAYSHSLRRASNYTLLQWSRRIILDWNKINVVAASKWSGKSFLWAKLCARELFKEWTGFWGRKIRQIKYFVPDLSNVGSSVMDYMKWFLSEFEWKRLPDGKPIIEIQAAKYTITCNLTGTTFRMVSLYNLGGTWATWEWLACDFAVIDEAAYIPDEFWTLFSQRALMETESMFIITTISEKTPRDHWFYSLLIDGELWDSMISSHRVTLLEKRELFELNYRSNMNPQTEEELSIMEQKLDKTMEFTINNLKKAWIKEYYARAFCVILDETQVFNIIGNVVSPEAAPAEDYYILWVDFWWNADPWALVLFNITKHIVQEVEEMKWIHYLDQVKEAKGYKDRFKNLTIIWDATTIGKVIMQEDQRKDNVIDYWVQFTGNGTWSWNNKWFYVSSKQHLVETTQLLLDKWVLQIWSNLGNLITQMKNFVKITGTKSSVAKYQGKGKTHDDLVDGLMLCIFWVVTILWLREEKELQDYWVEFDNQETYEYNGDNYVPSYNYSLNTY